MWRAYTDQGYLEYSFVETTQAMHPMYVIRALGGAMFLGRPRSSWSSTSTRRSPRRRSSRRRPQRAEAGSRRIRGDHVRHITQSACPATRSSRPTRSSCWSASSIAIAIGGLVEIVPLFYLKNTIEKVEGVRPYSPLELAGFNIYVREGCYLCHSQMIRPLRDEVERYGHYSLAAESMYDHPFQWGSKRNGPDLARVGGKYSDDWHRDHLAIRARWCRPRSCRATRSWRQTPLDDEHIGEHLVDAVARRRSLHARTMIDHAGRRSARAGRRQGRRRSGQALSRRRSCATSARQARDHRSRRADRLSAAARHAGRLQALRRQSQHSLRGLRHVRL